MNKQSNVAQMNGTCPSACSVSGCITGYWTDGYNTALYFGEDIIPYKNAGSETVAFNYCPIV